MAGKDEQTKATAETRGSSSGSQRSGDRKAHPDLAGTTLGKRYRLTERIGAGGFGAVYAARDERLDKLVAVKVLAPSVAETPAALTRFQQEAIAAARVGHEGIVDVTDFDEDAATGLHYIVMEHIAGCDLSAVLETEKRIPLVRALAIAARVAQALAAAHARNIIHRDLKPANILITSVGAVSDFPKLLDFGISKMVRLEDSAQTLTSAGQVVGTPRYMAPEQGTAGVAVDGRVDVYALGTILYEMITGQVPFTGSTHYEVIHFKLSRDPIPPSAVNPELDELLAVDRLVMKALARDADKRFASMADFEEAIRALLAKLDPTAESGVRPATPPPRPSAEMMAAATPPTLSTQALGPTPSRSSPSSQVLSGASGQVAVAPEPRPRWALRLAIIAAAGAIGVATALLVVGSDRPAAPPPPDPAPAEAAPSSVDLRFRVDPPGARIEVAGVEVTQNPLPVPRSDLEIDIAVSAPGYQTERRRFRPLTSGELRFELEPVMSPDAAPAAEPARPIRRDRTRPSKLPDSPL